MVENPNVDFSKKIKNYSWVWAILYNFPKGEGGVLLVCGCVYFSADDGKVLNLKYSPKVGKTNIFVYVFQLYFSKQERK